MFIVGKPSAVRRSEVPDGIARFWVAYRFRRCDNGGVSKRL